jgi:hypothetical protein
MHVLHALVSFSIFIKEKPVFHVLTSIRQRIAICFHALFNGSVRWMKPRSTSLLLGTITDLAKGRSELLVGTRCYGSNLSFCVGTSNDRPAGRQIGSSCCFWRGCLGPGSRHSSLCSQRQCFGVIGNFSACSGNTSRRLIPDSRGSLQKRLH